MHKHRTSIIRVLEADNVEIEKRLLDLANVFNEILKEELYDSCVIQEEHILRISDNFMAKIKNKGGQDENNE